MKKENFARVCLQLWSLARWLARVGSQRMVKPSLTNSGSCKLLRPGEIWLVWAELLLPALDRKPGLPELVKGNSF